MTPSLRFGGFVEPWTGGMGDSTSSLRWGAEVGFAVANDLVKKPAGPFQNAYAGGRGSRSMRGRALRGNVQTVWRQAVGGQESLARAEAFLGIGFAPKRTGSQGV